VEPVAVDMAALDAAWSNVRTALDQPAEGRPKAATVEPALATLMTGLATEFSDFLWGAACW
jgi:hypothetical protein